MDLPTAIGEIKAGHKFGDVYPLLDDQHRDGPFLKAFFVHGDPLACEVKPVQRNVDYHQRPSVVTGEMCKCGGFVRQTGTCKECTMCGDNSGGCG